MEWLIFILIWLFTLDEDVEPPPELGDDDEWIIFMEESQ
jgi:hypothetical protein